MLILLPPSEGKSQPRRGKRLALHALEFPELTEARAEVLTALIELCAHGVDSTTPLHDELLIKRAASVLGLGATQTDEVHLNGRLLTSATTRADRLYSGVLYDALDVGALSPAAKRRSTRWLAITSSLFGLVRPNDALPSYRLAGGVSLPGLGGVAAHWRAHLDPAVRAAAGTGLIVDLRSSTYAGFWRPTPDLAPKVATVRVLQQVGKERKIVSHFNKATKGRLVRDLLEDGGTPKTPAAFAEHLSGLGWNVEVAAPGRTSTQLDVIVDEV